jgi:hypothetical protein
MEKHHKLRRPAGSSIHGCNICGIEGHQAAQCTNGTVNWAQKSTQKWGSNANNAYQSGGGGGGSGGGEGSKEPDYADLAAQARAFAAKRLADEEAAAKKAEEVSPSEMLKLSRQKQNLHFSRVFPPREISPLVARTQCPKTPIR